MKKKLTLTIDESIKEQAKEYASQHQTSVSEMVEKYLDTITKEERDFKPEPGSWTESLIGIAKLPKEYEGMEYKKILEKELQKKYGS